MILILFGVSFSGFDDATAQEYKPGRSGQRLLDAKMWRNGAQSMPHRSRNQNAITCTLMLDWLSFWKWPSQIAVTGRRKVQLKSDHQAPKTYYMQSDGHDALQICPAELAVLCSGYTLIRRASRESLLLIELGPGGRSRTRF